MPSIHPCKVKMHHAGQDMIDWVKIIASTRGIHHCSYVTVLLCYRKLCGVWWKRQSFQLECFRKCNISSERVLGVSANTQFKEYSHVTMLRSWTWACALQEKGFKCHRKYPWDGRPAVGAGSVPAAVMGHLLFLCLERSEVHWEGRRQVQCTAHRNVVGRHSVLKNANIVSLCSH